MCGYIIACCNLVTFYMSVLSELWNAQCMNRSLVPSLAAKTGMGRRGDCWVETLVMGVVGVIGDDAVLLRLGVSNLYSLRRRVEISGSIHGQTVSKELRSSKDRFEAHL